MIGYLEGTVQDSTDSYLIVTTGGVGYVVYTTSEVLNAVPTNSPIALYIHTIVREQNLDLYGFRDREHKALFELLITISGIGPKVALGILNASTVANLVQAVESRDSSVLTKVSGIGKKNAEKIILELENKIDSSWVGSETAISNSDLEVFEALETLGYRSRDIQEALQEPDIRSLESKDKIRAIMKHLAA